jgi:hypothetical protein
MGKPAMIAVHSRNSTGKTRPHGVNLMDIHEAALVKVEIYIIKRLAVPGDQTGDSGHPVPHGVFIVGRGGLPLFQEHQAKQHQGQPFTF